MVLYASSIGSGLHQKIVDLCRDSGFAPNVASGGECNTHDDGDLVAAGMGISILPDPSNGFHWMVSSSCLPCGNRRLRPPYGSPSGGTTVRFWRGTCFSKRRVLKSKACAPRRPGAAPAEDAGKEEARARSSVKPSARSRTKTFFW